MSLKIGEYLMKLRRIKKRTKQRVSVFWTTL